MVHAIFGDMARACRDTGRTKTRAAVVIRILILLACQWTGGVKTMSIILGTMLSENGIIVAITKLVQNYIVMIGASHTNSVADPIAIERLLLLHFIVLIQFCKLTFTLFVNSFRDSCTQVQERL